MHKKYSQRWRLKKNDLAGGINILSQEHLKQKTKEILKLQVHVRKHQTLATRFRVKTSSQILALAVCVTHPLKLLTIRKSTQRPTNGRRVYLPRLFFYASERFSSNQCSIIMFLRSLRANCQNDISIFVVELCFRFQQSSRFTEK